MVESRIGSVFVDKKEKMKTRKQKETRRLPDTPPQKKKKRKKKRKSNNNSKYKGEKNQTSTMRC